MRKLPKRPRVGLEMSLHLESALLFPGTRVWYPHQMTYGLLQFQHQDLQASSAGTPTQHTLIQTHTDTDTLKRPWWSLTQCWARRGRQRVARETGARPHTRCRVLVFRRTRPSLPLSLPLHRQEGHGLMLPEILGVQTWRHSHRRRGQRLWGGCSSMESPAQVPVYTRSLSHTGLD